MEVRLAPYDISNEEPFELMFVLSKADIEYLSSVFSDHTDIYYKTDGCSLRNPGNAGAGIALLGRSKYKPVDPDGDYYDAP